MSTQPDPIGLAGGLNLYGYAGGDPINRHDPFGLRDVYVGCRHVDGEVGERGFNHCAVRIVNERMDVTFELLSNGILLPQTAGLQTDPKRLAAYRGSWSRVAVPDGMSSEDFDQAVFHSAIRRLQEEDGDPFWPSGGTNSNRYIYNIVKKAGGEVPSGAMAKHPGRKAPGLCGGKGGETGTDCAP